MTDSLPPAIRSLSNPKVRRLAKLRDNRTRRQAKSVLVDGWRESAHALQAGLELVGLYLSSEEFSKSQTSGNPGQRKILQQATQVNGLTLVTDAVMSKISFGQSPRGVVAEFKEPQSDLYGLKLSKKPLILILDRIEKPGNIGAVFRSADAAGVDAILLCDCTDRFNPNAIRNSQGAIFHVPSAVGSEQEITAFIGKQKIQPFAARVESSDVLWKIELTKPTAIILGNEADGLKERWQESSSGPICGIRIPMNGKTDSLNVSVTAAVIAMEAARQRSLIEMR